MPHCTQSLNAPRPYFKYWPEDGSLELKHVTKYVIMTLYIYIYIYICMCGVGLNKLLYEL